MIHHEVIVDLGDRSYPILLGKELLGDATRFLAHRLRSQRLFCVWDANVAGHARRLMETLDGRFEVHGLELPPGETTKSVRHLEELWDALSHRHFGRDTALVAIGGGVIGDLAGFAAATYLRGIDFIQVPTSLLAMVDSSVGGKTGINNRFGKNLLGAFWQPRLVLADLDALETLPDPELVSALAEVIKYGVIYDADFFRWTEANIGALRARDGKALAYAVKHSCLIKAEVVRQDERESGLREILNFGHTIGHAIENAAGYGRLRHGEAIAIGMLAESELALAIEGTRWTVGEHERLAALVEAAGLPTRIPEDLELTTARLMETARSDKKARAGAIRYALPTAMGTTRSHALADEQVIPILVRHGAREAAAP